MATYHIHPITGEVNACMAKNKCPFGDLKKDHYTTINDAQVAYEKTMGKFTYITHKKDEKIELPRKKEFIKILSTYANNMPKNLERSTIETFIKNFNNCQTLMDYEVVFAINTNLIDNSNLDDHIKNASEINNRIIIPYQRIISITNEIRENNREIFTLKLQLDKDEDESSMEDSLILSKIKNIDRVNRIFNDQLKEHLNDLENDYETLNKEINTKLKEMNLHIKPEESFKNSVLTQAKNPTSKEVEMSAREFIKSLSIVKEGNKYPPEMIKESMIGMYIDDKKRFKIIGYGLDSNVYHDVEKGIVHKIFHNKNSTLRKRTNGSQSNLKSNIDDEIILNLIANEFKEKYEKIDKEILKPYRCTIAPTFFNKISMSRENPMLTVISQPYYPKDLYYETSLDTIPDEVKNKAGVTDLHEGNCRVNINTGDIIIIDCITL